MKTLRSATDLANRLSATGDVTMSLGLDVLGVRVRGDGVDGCSTSQLVPWSDIEHARVDVLQRTVQTVFDKLNRIRNE